MHLEVCLVYLFRKPSHPLLEAFMSHMSKGSDAQVDGPLSSMPRYPSHSLCEMGELTQTGVYVQHLQQKLVGLRVSLGSFSLNPLAACLTFINYYPKDNMIAVV